MKRSFGANIFMGLLVAACFSQQALLAVVILDDGGTHTIDYIIDESIWVKNSPTDQPTTVILTDGGRVSGLDVWGDCKAYIYGGSTNNWDINSVDDSEVFIYGGLFRGIYSWGHQVTIYGTDFNHPYGYVTELQTNLTGILSNGDPINCYLGRTFDGETVAGEVLLVPEPCTLLLLSIGYLTIRKLKP